MPLPLSAVNPFSQRAHTQTPPVCPAAPATDAAASQGFSDVVSFSGDLEDELAEKLAGAIPSVLQMVTALQGQPAGAFSTPGARHGGPAPMGSGVPAGGDASGQKNGRSARKHANDRHGEGRHGGGRHGGGRHGGGGLLSAARPSGGAGVGQPRSASSAAPNGGAGGLRPAGSGASSGAPREAPAQGAPSRPQPDAKAPAHPQPTTGVPSPRPQPTTGVPSPRPQPTAPAMGAGGSVGSDIGVRALEFGKDGNAINPSTGNTNWNNYCLGWVNNAINSNGGNVSELRVGTAKQAYEAAKANGRLQYGNPPPGAIVFFPDADPNGNGHVGISLGNGRYRGTVPPSESPTTIGDRAIPGVENVAWMMPYS